MFGMSDLVRVKEASDLKELLKGAISNGGFGMTLRSGEMAVLHTAKGPKRIESVIPTHEEITGLLRQLTGSRCVREFRDNGVTRFMVPLEGAVHLVGAARLEGDNIHFEIRRTVERR